MSCMDLMVPCVNWLIGSSHSWNNYAQLNCSVEYQDYMILREHHDHCFSVIALSAFITLLETIYFCCCMILTDIEMIKINPVISTSFAGRAMERATRKWDLSWSFINGRYFPDLQKSKLIWIERWRGFYFCKCYWIIYLACSKSSF